MTLMTFSGSLGKAPPLMMFSGSRQKMPLVALTSSYREPAAPLVRFAASRVAVQKPPKIAFSGSLKPVKRAFFAPLMTFSANKIIRKNKDLILFSGSHYVGSERQIFKTPQRDFGLRFVVLAANGEALRFDMCQMGQNIVVKHARNENFVLDFEIIEKTRRTLHEPTNEINYLQWYGCEVSLSAVSDGAEFLLFRGKVINIDVNVFSGSLKISCSSQRAQQIEHLTHEQLTKIGVTNQHIHGDFNNGTDKNAELTARLSTLTASYDFTPQGVGYVNSWLPSNTPTRVIGDCDVYFRQPELRFAQWGSVLNDITIKITHEFTRVKQRTVQYYIDVDVGICNMGAYHKIPNYGEILNAAKGTGWELMNFHFERLPPSGWINCPSGATVGWLRPNDDKGVKNGRVWLAKRWEQPIKREYVIKISDSTSVARFGALKETTNYTVSQNEAHNIPLRDFGRYKQNDVPVEMSHRYISPVNNVIYADNRQVINLFWKNQTAKQADNFTQFIEIKNDTALRSAAHVAICMARAKIFDSHQKNTLKITTKFMPEISVADTHFVDFAHFSGSLKILAYEHHFDVFLGVAETQITYAFFVAGAAQHSSVAAQSIPSILEWGIWEITGEWQEPTDPPPAKPPTTLINAGIIRLPIGEKQAKDTDSGMVYRQITPLLYQPVGFQIATPDIDENETNEIKTTTELTATPLMIYGGKIQVKG